MYYCVDLSLSVVGNKKPKVRTIRTIHCELYIFVTNNIKGRRNASQKTGFS